MCDNECDYGYVECRFALAGKIECSIVQQMDCSECGVCDYCGMAELTAVFAIPVKRPVSIPARTVQEVLPFTGSVIRRLEDLGL